MENDIIKRLEKSAEIIEKSVNLSGKIRQFCEIVIEAINNGNKIFFCGNGGSAADAQHLTAEFTGRFLKMRKPLPAISLNTNVSAITAIANDYGYDEIFLRQFQALAQVGDVLVGITTSGNSKNIVKAFEYANSINVKTIALTGENGGKIKEYSDVLINVPSNDTPVIQQAHITIGHIMCEITENKLFEEAPQSIPVKYAD